jgi:molecular chaperone DnaJ
LAQPRDYYEVLGVPRDAQRKAIKEAFRQLALKYHPDRNKDPGAADRFKEIAEAYAILSDPKKRAEYDARGQAGVAGLSPEDLFGGIDFEDVFGGLGFDFGGLAGGGLFDRLFRRRAGPAQGANLEIELVVPLERVASGGKEIVQARRPVACPTCQGTGAEPGTAPRTCADCGGSGKKVKSERKEGITLQQISTCLGCAGQGVIIDRPCPQCAGQREVVREEKLSVKIPAGVEDGMVLRVPGHGLPGPAPGARPGDLYVIVRSAPDHRFERRGADLWRSETIGVAEAVLGTTVIVPSLDGEISAQVPPGTQPDTVLRLAGKGLPDFDGKGRGDLLIRLRVHVPDSLSEEERRLYDRLRALGEGRGGGDG